MLGYFGPNPNNFILEGQILEFKVYEQSYYGNKSQE